MIEMKNLSFKFILALFIFAAVIGLGYNSFSPRGINIFNTEDSDQTEQSLNNELGFIIPKINLSQAKKLLDDEEVIFIDARDNWDFDEGHIKGAINLPEYKFEDLVPEEIIPDKNILYVVYCSDEDCGTSEKLAEKLAKKGYANLLVFEGGWNSWLKEGLPFE